MKISIKKPYICFPSNCCLAPIIVIQNTENAGSHEQQKYWNQEYTVQCIG